MMRRRVRAFMPLMPLASVQRARSKPESRVLTTLIFVIICGVAHADVYRWVDDHGEAHYSDQWVPGSELIKSSKPHPMDSGSSQSSPAPKPAQSTQQSKEQQAAQQAIQQDVAKTKAAQCKQATERYQKAIEARRMYKPPQPGDTDRQYMSDNEIDAYRLQARNDVTLACGSAPAAMQPPSESPSQPPPAPSEAPSENPSGQ
jgi:hypothetical protein